MNEAVQAKYDGVTDVLYVTKGVSARPHRYEEDDDGLIWRVDQAGHCFGVTIDGYNLLWSHRAAQLVERIAHLLSVEAIEVRGIIPRVAGHHLRV